MHAHVWSIQVLFGAHTGSHVAAMWEASSHLSSLCWREGGWRVKLLSVEPSLLPLIQTLLLTSLLWWNLKHIREPETRLCCCLCCCSSNQLCENKQENSLNVRRSHRRSDNVSSSLGFRFILKFQRLNHKVQQQQQQQRQRQYEWACRSDSPLHDVRQQHELDSMKETTLSCHPVL